METKQLSSVPETMLIPLWARAWETENKGGLINDEIAKNIIKQIDYDFSKFKNGKLSQVGCCIRGSLIDKEAQKFLEKHPDAVVIQLGAGLDARYQRMNYPKVTHWFDLDLKESIDIRRQLIPKSENNTYLELSMFDYSWIEKVKAFEKPTLIIIEGVLMYFKPEDVQKFFITLCEQFNEATILFDMLAFGAVKHAKHHDTLRKVNGKAEFLWSELDTKIMETWHKKIHITKEYYMSDYDQGRFPLLIRLFYKFPRFYKRFNQRIVTLDIK